MAADYPSGDAGPAAQPASSSSSETRILAFKALPPRATAAKISSDDEVTDLSERQTVEYVCGELYRLCRKAHDEKRSSSTLSSGAISETAGAREGDSAAGIQKEDEKEKGDEKEHEMWQIEEKDIVSAAEAKRSTGYLESLGYSLKKLVWS